MKNGVATSRSQARHFAIENPFSADATNVPRFFLCVNGTDRHCRHLAPFYKSRSQEKTHLLRLEFFLLLSPLDRARSVLTCRAMCSVAGPCDPVDWVFSTSGFHRFLATKPVSSETSKAERRSNLATIVLSGTRGP